MTGRGTTAVIILALASMAGCGLMKSEMMTLDAYRPGSITTTFDAPVNRVLAVAFQADEANLIFGEETVLDFPGGMLKESSRLKYPSLNVPDGTLVKSSDLEKIEFDVDDFELSSGKIVGKTKDGRPATLWLFKRDLGKKTEASLLIGTARDYGRVEEGKLGLAYLDNIQKKLEHPTPRPANGTEKPVPDPKAIAPTPKDNPPPTDRKGLER